MAFLWGMLVLAGRLPGAAAQASPRPGAAERCPSEDRVVRRLRAPEGFQISLFARGLGAPRQMAVGEDGTVYVTRPPQNDVIALRDHPGANGAETPQVVLAGIAGIQGIAEQRGRLYVAIPGKVLVADLGSDGVAMPLRPLTTGLPEGAGAN